MSGKQLENRLRHAAEAAASLIEKVMRTGDRSCWSCDYLDARAGMRCMLWKEPVPTEHLESGCEKHQAHGAPF